MFTRTANFIRKIQLTQLVKTSIVTRAVAPTVTREMSTRNSLDLSGLFPPIPTPFDKDENIDYAKLAHNMDLWNQADLSGYVVMGSNGEAGYQTKSEKAEVVARVKQLSRKDRIIIGGSGCESTRQTILLTKQMAEAGAQAALVISPFYYKAQMNNQAMIQHYKKVAEESPIPVILYNVPSNTGIDIAPDVVVELSSHPNIIGLKDSGGDISRIGDLVFKTRDQDFQILSGSASFLYPALSVGCVGGVCALSNVLAKETCQLLQLFKEGKHSEAKALQHRLIAPNTGVTKKFGVPGLKQAMEWFGYYGGPTRSPLQPLSTEDCATLKKMFTDSGFTPKDTTPSV